MTDGFSVLPSTCLKHEENGSLENSADRQSHLACAVQVVRFVPTKFSVHNLPIRQKEIAMLVLTRKLDESLRIGDDIKITVLRIKGNTIRIGIEAPKNVRVLRDELGLLASPRQEESDQNNSPVIAAVVDSPSHSSTRMFVGSVAAKGSGNRPNGDSRREISLFEVEATIEEDESAERSATAPLSRFVRGNRCSTAV